MAAPWWKDGIRFECTGSGKCCVSRGEYGFVYLTRKDRFRLAAHLGVTTTVFNRRYCEKADGWYRIKDLEPGGACRFLDGTRCSVYEARPIQCRTWPFWPENMDARTWTREVATFCPGVGTGRVVPAEEIARVLAEQRAADEEP